MTAVAAAFVDRDGVLNVRPAEHEYVADVSDFRWLPGAADGVALLNAMGYRVVVVSNQRGVARGLVSIETLSAIETRIRADLLDLDACIEGFYYCRHGVHEACSCRKPRPGLLLRAAAERDLDVAQSVMIGDSETDVEAGRAAGCAATVLIAPERIETAADIVAADLADAASLVGTFLSRP